MPWQERNDPIAIPDEAPTTAASPEKTIITRTRQRYAAVQQLYARGAPLSAIASTLELDVHTVRRFARASGLDELLIKTLQRAACSMSTSPTCTTAGSRAASIPIRMSAVTG